MNADVLPYNDYYPFGMLVPNRYGSSTDYRYGFNGMEKDDELKGEGNSYDFGARMFDPRVGRWFKPDPFSQKYPSMSVYCAFANNPIFYVDPDGREIKVSSEVVDGKTIITITITGKVINDTGTEYSKDQLQIYTDRIVEAVQSIYTGSEGDVTWKAVANITLATKENPLNAKDHAIRIVKDGEIPLGDGFMEKGTPARAPFYQNVLYISDHILDRVQATEGQFAGTGKTILGQSTLERAVTHEIGHSGGVLKSNIGGEPHPEDDTMDGNLLHQSKKLNAGIKLTKEQILEIKENYDASGLNQGKQKL